MNNKLYEWIPLKNGDNIPENAVYCGQTSDDGKVYVAKFDNSPGKVNLKDGKINNFWSQSYSYPRTEGEVLISHGKNKWIELRNGENIPQGAILSGRDYRLDKVWVGKDVTTDEPGKITCIDSNEEVLRMCHLWCHSYWRTSRMKIANILIIEVIPKPISNEILNNISEDICTWGENLQYSRIEENLKSINIEVSVDNIVSTITKTIALISGDLTQIINMLKIDIKAKIESTTADSEIANKNMISDVNKNCYIMLKYYKNTIKKKTILGGIFSRNSINYNLIIEYAVLQPENSASREKCENLQRKFADEIINELEI